jgi:type I restriction enzyme S subunit
MMGDKANIQEDLSFIPQTSSLSRRRFRSYAEYVEINEEWLPKLPKGWEALRFKRVARLMYGDSLPAEEREPGEVRVYGSNGPVGEHSCANTLAPALVIGRKGSYGKLNYTFEPVFAIDTTYFVDARSSDMQLRWLFYVTQLLGLDTYSEDSAIPGLSREFVYSRTLPVPTVSEQSAIAEFLDREMGKIDSLVAKKERLIELLQEQRTALITHAVTKGLDSDVPMRDSSVEWLGEIPAHWEIKKLKGVSTLQTGITLGKKYEGEQLEIRPYLRVANVQDGYLDLDDIAEIELPTNEIRRYELCEGDVVITEGGDFDKLGRGYVWESQIAGCLHQNHIFAVRPDMAALNSRFLAAVMSSNYGRAYFTATSKQSTNLASTNSTKLRNFPLPLPRRSEQNKIIDHLHLEGEKVDSLIAKTREGIDRLKEFRTAVISAAVTGKIDVREEVG